MATAGAAAAATALPTQGLAADSEPPDTEDSKRPKQNSASEAMASDKDQKSKEKLGHRRIGQDGVISYKKVNSNHLMGSIQLGLGHAVGNLSKHDDRDLLMQDFMTVETTQFPKNGSSQTPAHSFSEYTFRTFAPLAFRYFLNLFGIQRDDFLVSLCSSPMRELSNPGASGSIFYLTYDDEFILKTVQHKEAEFLQKLLPGYYMNLNQNPHTLLPKFFGMYTYQCNQKNIRVTIMNNLLPSNIKMHLKFDLKGSTFKRKANKRERAKSSPTFKDLDFVEILPEGLMLEAETYNALITTMRRDCRVLESFRIMDYSLLVGIHNLDQAAKEQAERNSGVSPTKEQARREADRKMQRYAVKQTKMSTPMESIQAQTEPIDDQDHLPPGGIPARNHRGERLLLYLGVIDILQSYRMAKKLEHVFKAIIHDGDTVSVHRPGFYAHRFLDFMADKVFKKIPSLDLPEVTGTHRKFRSIVSSLIALKHSPSKRQGKRDSIKKLTSDSVPDSNPSAAQTSTSVAYSGATSAVTVSHGNELGQLRGFGAISAAMAKSTQQKLSEQQAAAPGSSVEDSNPESPEAEPTAASAVASPEAVDTVDTSAVAAAAISAGNGATAEEFPTSGGNGNGQNSGNSGNEQYNSAHSSFRFDSCGLNSIQQPGGISLVGSAPGIDPAAETLNIPAVLWDRPTGSSKRVPPPVPPRSPRRPYDHSISFAEASDTSVSGYRGDLTKKSSDVSLPLPSMLTTQSLPHQYVNID